MEKQFEVYSDLAAHIHYDALTAYYEAVKKEMAICNYAQLIDTHSHAKTRTPMHIKNYFLQRHTKPFVFIICLN